VTVLLDRAFASIMATMIDTGQAPHYTELAADLGLRPDEGRELVHELMEVIPGWTHPGTDYIASFPPFNNQPTQYRISVDGIQKWFGQ
jgi:hypothetical protein